MGGQLIKSYINPSSRALLKRLLQSDKMPEVLKNEAKKIICHNYIPFALSESYIFVKKHKIPKYLHRDFNSAAMNGLIKGVEKYDWNYEKSNISIYLKKYIIGELYKNINLNTVIYDNVCLEWQLSKYNTDNTKSYYDNLRENIIKSTHHLEPFEKKLFFLVYSNSTLERSDYSVSHICDLVGINNPETYRQNITSIIEKIKKYYNLYYSDKKIYTVENE